MSPERLKELVAVGGGVRAFAALLRVSPRAIYYWLEGAAPVTPSRADQIDRLARERGWLS